MEKDGIDSSKYYLSFDYDSLNDFELNIYFNVSSLIDFNDFKKDLQRDGLLADINLKLAGGMCQKYTDSRLYIICDKLVKKRTESTHDIAIECISYKASDPCVQSSALLTLCKLSEDKAYNNISYKIKAEFQKLLVRK